MSKKVKQKENRRVTGRRTFLLGSGMLLATSFLSGRLYQLQVAQNNRYKRLSDRNQFDRRVVPPRAGVLSTGRNAFLPAMPILSSSHHAALCRRCGQVAGAAGLAYRIE